MALIEAAGSARSDDPAGSAAPTDDSIRMTREPPMTAPDALYDHIGTKYDDYARMATLKSAER